MIADAGRRAGPLCVAAAFLLAAATRPAAALGKPEWELELDPYYSDVALTIPFFTTVATGPVRSMEILTYLDMMKQAFIPKFMLLEASVNPLPLGSVLFRNSDDGLYRRAKVTPSLNVVEAITAGFEEPYALSLFLGNIVDFSQGKKTLGHRRKGYMGYLLSYGNYHIMESLLIPDNWVEIEGKIKGDLVTDERKLGWSFRSGAKLHSDREISDSFYGGIRRDRIEYGKGFLAFLLSSGIDYRADFRRSDFKALSHFIKLEKNFPFKTSKRAMTFSLGLGWQWLSKDKYLGTLADRRLRPETRIMIRPNLKF